jgi:hypothetical protein
MPVVGGRREVSGKPSHRDRKTAARCGYSVGRPGAQVLR